MLHLKNCSIFDVSSPPLPLVYTERRVGLADTTRPKTAEITNVEEPCVSIVNAISLESLVGYMHRACVRVSMPRAGHSKFS